MTTGFAQDDYIRSLEDRIAELEAELAKLHTLMQTMNLNYHKTVEELARAREALVGAWSADTFFGKSIGEAGALSRYASEIAQQGEEG